MTQRKDRRGPRPERAARRNAAGRSKGGRDNVASNPRHEVLYGFHAVTQALEMRADAVLALWISGRRKDERMSSLTALAAQAGVNAQLAEDATLDRLCDGERHQGVVARVRARALGDLPALLAKLEASPADVLVLDGVCDPHNLGACLRVAAAAGIGALVLPRAHASPITPTVHKVASGGAEVVEIFAVPNVARALRDIGEAGLQIVGLAGEAQSSLFELSLERPTAFVMGTESTGLRRLSREHCDVLAAIPMPGPMESLNLSVSAGIVLFEAVRQRAMHQTH